MDFEFSADQELLRATLRRFLAEQAPVSPYVRAQLDNPRGTADDVWRGLADLGVTGLLVPDAHGGAGRGMVDQAVVLEELGRAVHPGPYQSSAIGAVSLVLSAGDERDFESLLPGLASGDTTGTVALYEPDSRSEWRTPVTSARAVGDGWAINGTKVHVPDAVAADVLLVTATTDDGLGVFAVRRDAEGVVVEATPTVDGTRKQASVVLRDAPAWRLGGGGRGGRGPGASEAAVAEAVDRLAVASVLDGVGAASRALELAVEYAKEREQFGRPIGAFQAVQQICADMLRAVELARGRRVLRRLGVRRGRCRANVTAPRRWRRRSPPTSCTGWERTRSRSLVESASRGSTTSTSITSASSPCNTQAAAASSPSKPSPPSSSTDGRLARTSPRTPETSFTRGILSK